MTLIHTALLSEAQYIIEKLKLNLISKNPRIYTSKNIVLVISNVGKENTIKSLELIYAKYKIAKAINIGIAGCSDKNIEINSLFCTNKNLNDIKHMKLQTVTKVQTKHTQDEELLYDMEAEYFEEISLSYLREENIFIFKVVSDHLDDTMPSKELVKQLIKNSMKSWEKWI